MINEDDLIRLDAIPHSTNGLKMTGSASGDGNGVSSSSRSVVQFSSSSRHSDGVCGGVDDDELFAFSGCLWKRQGLSRSPSEVGDATRQVARDGGHGDSVAVGWKRRNDWFHDLKLVGNLRKNPGPRRASNRGLTTQQSEISRARNHQRCDRQDEAQRGGG